MTGPFDFNGNGILDGGEFAVLQESFDKAEKDAWGDGADFDEEDSDNDDWSSDSDDWSVDSDGGEEEGYKEFDPYNDPEFLDAFPNLDEYDLRMKIEDAGYDPDNPEDVEMFINLEM